MELCCLLPLCFALYHMHSFLPPWIPLPFSLLSLTCVKILPVLVFPTSGAKFWSEWLQTRSRCSFLDPFQSGLRPAFGTETALVALYGDLCRETREAAQRPGVPSISFGWCPCLDTPLSGQGLHGYCCLCSGDPLLGCSFCFYFVYLIFYVNRP